MGAQTDAARAEVVASRQALLTEIVALRASAKSAIDIPAKIKRAPVKTAALVGGTAFFLLKGPQRLYHMTRRAVLGPKADLPKTMLPKEVHKALRSLGDDGERVRAVVEREFAGYLAEHRKDREARSFGKQLTAIGSALMLPVSAAAGKRLARELFKPQGAVDRAAASAKSRK